MWMTGAGGGVAVTVAVTGLGVAVLVAVGGAGRGVEDAATGATVGDAAGGDSLAGAGWKSARLYHAVSATAAIIIPMSAAGFNIPGLLV